MSEIKQIDEEKDATFLKEIFYVFDKGKDGDISCQEIRNILAKLGFTHSVQDIDEMIRDKDIDQDGRINFDEFYTVFKRDPSGLEKMRELRENFSLLDTNKDGKIDRKELEAYFSNIGVPLSKEELDNMMLIADVDHSGYVEFEEFVSMMSQ